MLFQETTCNAVTSQLLLLHYGSCVNYYEIHEAEMRTLMSNARREEGLEACEYMSTITTLAAEHFNRYGRPFKIAVDFAYWYTAAMPMATEDAFRKSV